MNEFLTQHYLSLKWDKSYVNAFKNASISEDTVVSVLNSILPEWSSEITHVTEIKGEMIVVTNLYIPGKVFSGMGSSDMNAICNIINKIICNVNTNSDPIPQTITMSTNEDPKQTTENVLNQLEQIQANVHKKEQSIEPQPAPNNTNILDDLLSMGQVQTEAPKEEPKEESVQLKELKEGETEYLDFDSPEAREYEKQFWDGVNGSAPVPATPEGMNPNMVYMKNKWNTEQGNKLRAWMAEHNVSKKEEMDAWLKRYCGLEYDYFDPTYLDYFITWANQLREKQIY